MERLTGILTDGLPRSIGA